MYIHVHVHVHVIPASPQQTIHALYITQYGSTVYIGIAMGGPAL